MSSSFVGQNPSWNLDSFGYGEIVPVRILSFLHCL
jgi:hypothetical protein